VSKTVPLSVEFAVQVRGAIAVARTQGRDVAEQLNAKELLLSPFHERRLQVEALQRFADELERWQAHEMLRRKYHTAAACTPADMYVVVKEFLDEFIQHRKERE
jgi:hypothetical protein